MALETPLFVEPVTYTATQFRRLLDAIISVDGIIHPTDCIVTQRAAGANMSVDVAAGQIAITGTSVANQGTYLATSTASVNCAVTAAPGSGTRTDLVVAQIYDNEVDSSGLQAWTPLVVTNPSVGTGTPPATPANAFPLATLTVASGVASILNANITDVRVTAVPVGTPFIQKGSYLMTFTSGVATGTVTFPRAFPGVPTVIVSTGAITGNTSTTVNTTGVTATTFSYRAAPDSGATGSYSITGFYIAAY